MATFNTVYITSVRNYKAMIIESFKKSLRMTLYGVAVYPPRDNDYGVGQAVIPIFENANGIIRVRGSWIMDHGITVRMAIGNWQCSSNYRDLTE